MLIFGQTSCFLGSFIEEILVQTDFIMQTRFKKQDQINTKKVLPFPACGKELREEKGNIESPNYPSTYPANVACVWIITVPTGYQVNFEIQNIQVSLVL
jgi:cubilin